MRCEHELGARRVAPLYGHVDPDVHAVPPGAAIRRADLSYLGTYAADRQRGARAVFRGAGPALPASERFVIWRRAISAGFPLDREHLLRPPSAAGGASGVLLLVPAHAQRHAAGHGGDGLVPVRPAVRGGRLRRGDPVAIGGKGWTHSSNPGAEILVAGDDRGCARRHRAVTRRLEAHRAGRHASGPWRNTPARRRAD